MKILFINACVRENSRTMLLARYLLKKLPGEITEIRLEEEKLKPLSEYSLAKRDGLLSERRFDDDVFCYARQFAVADCIVIAAPYWDLAFPALLKIYLEAVTVSGITFCYENDRPKGLCIAKRLYYVTTSGGPIIADFGYPYVEALAKSLYGISDTFCIKAENLDIDGADVEVILGKAKEEINTLIKKTLIG